MEAFEPRMASSTHQQAVARALSDVLKWSLPKPIAHIAQMMQELPARIPFLASCLAGRAGLILPLPCAGLNGYLHSHIVTDPPGVGKNSPYSGADRGSVEELSTKEHDC